MGCVAIRWLISLTMAFIGLVTYFSRMNINYAIVDMVIRTNKSAEYTVLCPAAPHRNQTADSPITPVEDDGHERFDWSPEVQGLVLGSFFWLYCVFQTPSGYIAGRFGGWIPMCVSLLASGLISLSTPILTHLYSAKMLIVMRALMGIFQSAIFPGLFATACAWAPVQERSTMLAINELGPNLGTIVTQFASGYLIQAFSWTALFYLPGGVSLVAFVVVLLFLRSRPEDHPLVSEQELAHIRHKGLQETSLLTRSQSESSTVSDDTVANCPRTEEAVPWIGMLSSKAVWAFFFFKFSRSCAAYLLISEIPTYLATVLQQDVVTVGIITSIGTAFSLLSLFLSALISESLVQRRYMTRTNSRKLFSLLVGLVNAISLMLIPTLRCNEVPVIGVLFVAAFLYGCQTGSDTPLPAEMSTKFYAVLFAIGNLFGTIPGFLTPMVSGYVLGMVEDQWLAWSIIFYSICGLLIFANLVFLVYGSASRQDFDFSDSDNRARGYDSTRCRADSVTS